MRKNVHKIRTGMKWVGWDDERLAKELNVSIGELRSALAGNGRGADIRLLSDAEAVIRRELDRQCEELERVYEGLRRMGEALRI